MKFNIVLTLSREYAIERVLSDLEQLKKPKGTSLLVMADMPSNSFIQARNAFTDIKEFDEVLVQHYRPPSKFNREIKEYETVIRRQRISDIHNEAKQYLWDGDYILVIEDDDIIPPDSLTKLLETLEANPDAGAITGWQVSRHNKPFVGAYILDNLEKPLTVTSALPGEMDEIDACGLYFLLTRGELYGNHNFKPWGNVLGPDVDFTVNIRKQGYRILVNWDVPIPHFNKELNKAIPINKLWRSKITRGNYAWDWSYSKY